MDQLTRDGVVLRFEDAGKGAPPLLLVHDPDLAPSSLAPQFAHFSARHRVVIPDLQRRGGSRGFLSPNELRDVASDLAWLCYELGVYRPIAIGHLIGGLIAVELSTRFPDLLAALVTVDAPIEAGALAPGDAGGNYVSTEEAGVGRLVVPWLRIETAIPRASTYEQQGELVPFVSVNGTHLFGATQRLNTEIEAFISKLGR